MATKVTNTKITNYAHNDIENSLFLVKYHVDELVQVHFPICVHVWWSDELLHLFFGGVMP